MLPLLLLAYGWIDPAPKPSTLAPLPEVRRVVAFIVETADKNRERPRPLAGDALAGHYLRQAARFAREHQISPRAFLVGLGVALDRSDQLRFSRVVNWYLKEIETDAQRERRLSVLGKPSLLGREDWLQHFVVCGALTAQLGPTVAEEIGILKELKDSLGRSGFSFADLAADNAGICFARGLLDPGRDAGKELTSIAKSFDGNRCLPEMKDLEDGLPQKDLVRKYGDPGDPRFKKACQAVRQRVEELPVFRSLDKKK